MNTRIRRLRRLAVATVSVLAVAALVGGAAASHVAPTVRDLDMANIAGVESELSLVVDPHDANHIAAGANYRPPSGTPPVPGQRWYVSNDGGRTWSSGPLPYGTLTLPGQPNPTMSDPSLDFGSDGEIYYGALINGGNGDPCTLFIAASEDDGGNWTDPASGIVATGTTPPAVCNDKEHILVDRTHNDNVYIAWTPFDDVTKGATNRQVVFSRDLNGVSDGLNFSGPAILSDPGCFNHGADLGLGGDAVYVAWTRYTAGCESPPPSGDPGTVYVVKSADQGASWSSPVAVATLENVETTSLGLRARSFPSIDVDPATGRVFLVYATYTDVPNRTDADVMMVSSPDGASWTPPTRVNQDSGSSDQWNPWLDVANGRVHVCFYTRAYDGGNINFACSYGAATASPSLTETRISSQSTAAAFDLPLGDYNGAFAGTDAVLHPAWGDARSGVGGPTDAYTARVDFSPPTAFTVAPLAPSRQVGAIANFTATVTGAHGEPEQFIPVTFAVTSSGFPGPKADGSLLTGPAGTAGFSYTNLLPGTDTLRVFVDLDEDGVADSGETLETTVTWLPPASTNGARVTGDGTIALIAGGEASFNLSVHKKATDLLPKGNVSYSAPGLLVASTAIASVVVAGDDATIFGTGTVNGGGSVPFRIDVTDGGEPSTNDRFEIRLAGGYDSTLRPLTSGNIQTH